LSKDILIFGSKSRKGRSMGSYRSFKMDHACLSARGFRFYIHKIIDIWQAIKL